jgi:regulator of protease activity HflC (stomatin/prohibitin superfamily)
MKNFILILVSAITFSGCATIDTGFRGVPLNYGKPTGEVYSEGLYWFNPLSTHIEQMNVQTVADNVEASASSIDLQSVQAKVTVNYHLDPGQVVHVYDTLRQDYEDRVINPTVQESVKAATARDHAQDLIAHRTLLRDYIEHDLTQRLKTYGIVVDQVLITDFAFDKTYQDAVEAKVAAQQNLQTAQLTAQAVVTSARGAAEAQALQRQTLTPELVTLKMLDKWDGHFPQVMGNANPFVQLQETPSEPLH